MSKEPIVELNFPVPNFTIKMGDAECDIQVSFQVKKTKLNRIKYWLFCKFFPFRITRWDNSI